MRVVEDVNIAGQLADELERNARNLVRTTIHRIEARYKASLSGPRSGRAYRKGAVTRRMSAKRAASMGLTTFTDAKGKNRAIVGYVFHRASAPGEAPATDTGNLAGSIGARMTGKLIGEVGSTAEYAAVLEFGGAHMAARPALTPAVKAEWPEFENGMKTLIKDRGNG